MAITFHSCVLDLWCYFQERADVYFPLFYNNNNAKIRKAEFHGDVDLIYL